MINPAEQRGNIALVFSSSVSHGDRLKTTFAQYFNNQTHDYTVNKYTHETINLLSHIKGEKTLLK